MKANNSSRGWKFIGLGFVACLLCLSQYQLRQASPSHSPEASLPIFSPLEHEHFSPPSPPPPPHLPSPPPEIKIALLLQISPVDHNNRLKRLLSIDQGWSTWKHSLASRTDIFAPQIPFSSHNFRNIQTFPVKGTNPFHKMVESFFKILQNQFSLRYDWIQNQFSLRYDWMLFGNDHTFLIPQNLRCYLKTLDHTKLVYAGNKLRITFQGKTLYFASGGAGAILSRPALLSIVSVWTVLHPEMVLEILQRQTPSLFLEENLRNSPLNRGQNLTIDVRDEQLQDSQIFYRLLNWTLDNSLTRGSHVTPLKVTTLPHIDSLDLTAM
jgi:hypothetical protein